MKPGIRPLPLLVLAFTMGSFGCTRPWKVHACYQGAPRAFGDVAVLLLDKRMLPVFRVHSIDDVNVPDATEYHLLPGTHSVITGVSRGKTTNLPISCVPRAGYVYRLTADVWNLSDCMVPMVPTIQRVECDWRPRLTELGRFEDLTSGESIDPTICDNVHVAPLRFWIQAQDGIMPADEVGAHAHFVGTGFMSGILPELLMAKPTEMPPGHWGKWPRNQTVAPAQQR
jgi:hypothetical protein